MISILPNISYSGYYCCEIVMMKPLANAVCGWAVLLVTSQIMNIASSHSNRRYRNTIVHAATETRCPSDQPLLARPALQSLIRERDPLPSPSPQEEIFRDLNIFKREVVVLLVTIKDVEAWAVLSFMSPPESNGQPLYAENRTTNLYNPMRKTVLTLGMFGGHKTALLWAKVGDDSRAEIENALELLPNVQLIATVGVAYGVDSKKTQLGDVLVSTTIDGIGNIRWESGNLIFDEGDNRYTRIEQRALDVFATEVDDWVAITKFNVTTCGRQPKVHTDAIIGLPWFINDVKILSQVVANSPAAIGGEMEGHVIASIHNDLLDLNPPKEIDVIVIKGVAEFAGHGHGSCDWYFTASVAAAGYMDFKLTQTRNQIYRIPGSLENSVKGASGSHQAAHETDQSKTKNPVDKAYRL